MSDWGNLDDEESTSASPNDGWGALDGTTTDSTPPPEATATSPNDDWGILDADAPAPPEATASGSRPTQAITPSPEATASLLSEGETVWAKVDRSGATLGSGQRVTLANAATDQLFGWRQVRIIDPGRLRGELVPIQWSSLARPTADDPSMLYRAPVALPQDVPRRVPGFPVGLGPDLETLFNRRVETARTRYERKAREAAERADKRIAEREKEFQLQIDQERQRAARAIAQAEHQVSSIRTTADAEIARYQGYMILAAIGAGAVLFIMLMIIATVGNLR